MPYIVAYEGMYLIFPYGGKPIPGLSLDPDRATRFPSKPSAHAVLAQVAAIEAQFEPDEDQTFARHAEIIEAEPVL